MSSIQDFAPSRGRTHTSTTSAPPVPMSSNRVRTNTGGTLPVPMSPIARDNPSLDRRGSTMSHSSVAGSLRFRHPLRSRTVVAYNEPEKSEPVWQPGAEPGIDASAADDKVPPEVLALKAQCEISIVDFSADDVRHIRGDNETLPLILKESRPDDMPCRWVSVNGLSWDVIRCIGKHYNLHDLAIEDLVHTRTRTKVDWYADHACVILTLQKLVRLHNHRHSKNHPENCGCTDADLDFEGRPHRHKWYQTRPKRRIVSDLPYSLDKDGDGQIDEFVDAHVDTSTSSAIKQVRTLHRYESKQIPEHTAFMESHSSLAAENLSVSVEQVSIFLLADNTVISFFEQSAEDVEKPILKRLESTETILRRSCDGSLLLESIIDAIVDLAIPVKDAYNKARKELQVDALVNPNIATSRSLHIFGEEIDMLQNLFKPIVHLVNALRDHNASPGLPQSIVSPQMENQDPLSSVGGGAKRDRDGAPQYARKASEYRKTGPLRRSDTATSVSITPLAHTYFGDVLDHCITMIQALEQMDASATNISTLIFNTVGAKTNNFMMILAVVTVFFSPLTFISGYFGMNFAGGKGLLHPFAFFWYVAIPVLVAFMGLVFATMLWSNIKDFFEKRGIRAHRHRRNTARRHRDYL